MASSVGRSWPLGRRGNREGSVNQRGAGRGVAAVSDRPGEKDVPRRPGQAEAAATLTAGLNAGAYDLPLSPERQTVGDFLSRWLEMIARPTLRPAAYVCYAGVVHHHLRRQQFHDLCHACASLLLAEGSTHWVVPEDPRTLLGEPHPQHLQSRDRKPGAGGRRLAAVPPRGLDQHARDLAED